MEKRTSVIVSLTASTCNDEICFLQILTACALKQRFTCREPCPLKNTRLSFIPEYFRHVSGILGSGSGFSDNDSDEDWSCMSCIDF